MKEKNNQLADNLNKFFLLKRDLKKEIFDFLPLEKRLNIISKLNKTITSYLNNCSLIKNLKENMNEYLIKIEKKDFNTNLEIIEDICAQNEGNEIYYIFDIFNYLLTKLYSNLTVLSEYSRKNRNILKFLQQILIKGNNVKFEYLNKIKFFNLISLDFSYNYIDSDLLRFLSLIYFPNLEKLILYYNNISDEGMKILSELKLFNLNSLYLGENQIPDKEMQFINIKNFLSLKRLFLGKNLITDSGVKYLYEGGIFKNMETLILVYNQLTDESLTYFNKENCNNFKNLLLIGNNFSQERKEQKKNEFTSIRFEL